MSTAAPDPKPNQGMSIPRIEARLKVTGEHDPFPDEMLRRCVGGVRLGRPQSRTRLDATAFAGTSNALSVMLTIVNQSISTATSTIPALPISSLALR